ncbi:MAG: cell division protein FtsZ, partial [Desulfomonilaceae bacterium]
SIIQNEAHDDANIIFGAVIDEDMGDAVNVTVIATGFGRTESGILEKNDSLAFPKNGSPVVDEVKTERPVARTIVPSEPRNSQIPAFIRKSQREKVSRHLNIVDDFSLEGEEDLDIPTFLRKHAD